METQPAQTLVRTGEFSKQLEEFEAALTQTNKKESVTFTPEAKSAISSERN